MDADSLIQRTAAAVAEGYRTLDVSQAAGLLLNAFYSGGAEELAPLVLELREGEVTPDVDRNGEQRELWYPEVRRDPPVFALCEALDARMNADEDGYVLLEVYWLALANRLHDMFRIPVLVPEIEMPIAEQLRRQGALPAAPDPLAGLDVLVSWPLDEHRTAAVWLEEEMDHRVGSVHAPADPEGLGWNTQLGGNPEVRAGWLPPGAVAASVRDRAGVWHEARHGRDVWLCVLPQRAGQGDPPVIYNDVEGTVFELAVEADGLPAVWPRQAPQPGRLSQRGDDVIGLHGGDWYVFVEDHAGREIGTEFRPIPGSVLGHPHGFGLEPTDDGWRAVAVCGTFTVDVQGVGDPPARLDLDAWA